MGVLLDIPRSPFKKIQYLILHPSVVLLDPEGCTSSKLPARLDVKKIDSQEHSVVMCMCQCKLVYVLSFNLCYHILLFSCYATCFFLFIIYIIMLYVREWALH